jgi:hypothetical protein
MEFVSSSMARRSCSIWQIPDSQGAPCISLVLLLQVLHLIRHGEGFHNGEQSYAHVN